MAPRYWMGLLMFCMAAIFTVALGSVLQHHAVAQQEAAISAYREPVTASLLPSTVYRASFGY